MKDLREHGNVFVAWLPARRRISLDPFCGKFVDRSASLQGR